MIKIVGIGPGDSKYITKEVLDVLQSSSVIYMRTNNHPSYDFIKTLNNKISSFDYIYEGGDSFDDVYMSIADKLIELSEGETIVYAVPGNPLVAEKAVDIIKQKLEESDYEIYYGVSFLDLIISRLKIDPVKGFSVVDAANLSEQCLFHRGYMVVMQCYDRILASELKIWLSKFIEDDDEVIVVNSVGTDALEEFNLMKLYELDQIGKFDDMTSIVVNTHSGKKSLSDVIISSEINASEIDQSAEINNIKRAIERIESNSNSEDFDMLLEDDLSIILKSVINISSFNSDKYFDFFNLI